MKRIAIAVLAVAFVSSLGLATVGFQSDNVNDKCPLSGNAVVADKSSEVTVKFCCNNCKGKFVKDPVPTLVKVDKLPNENCPIANKPAKDASATVSIGFCCGNCKGKFDAEPTKFLPKVVGKEKKK